MTAERLGQIERAESALRALGFREFRVRHHGDVARIEVAAHELDQALRHRTEIAREVLAAGFRFAALDLEGFRGGGRLYSIAPARDGGQ